MQLQVECAGVDAEQSCCICDHEFKPQHARIILCSDQGVRYGEVCPHCVGKGYAWLNNRFEQISKPRKPVRSPWKQKVDTRLPA